jgi:DNA-binding MarR family transcriptional regulator
MSQQPRKIRRSNTPETSVDALKSLDVSNLEGCVLRALIALGNRGGTSEEIADQLGMNLQTITPRLKPLENKGLVERTGEKRKGSSNRARVVFRLAKHVLEPERARPNQNGKEHVDQQRNVAMNPYRLLQQKLTACLRLEAKLTKEEREANEMSFLVKFGDTRVTLLKGGVNTIAYTLGNGQRKVCYPDDALEMLDKLAKREHWYYEVGGVTRFHIAKIVKLPPTQIGEKIYGVNENGKKLLYVAKPVLGSDTGEWRPMAKVKK